MTKMILRRIHLAIGHECRAPSVNQIPYIDISLKYLFVNSCSFMSCV